MRILLFLMFFGFSFQVSALDYQCRVYKTCGGDELNFQTDFSPRRSSSFFGDSFVAPLFGELQLQFDRFEDQGEIRMILLKKTSPTSQRYFVSIRREIGETLSLNVNLDELVLEDTSLPGSVETDRLGSLDIQCIPL